MYDVFHWSSITLTLLNSEQRYSGLVFIAIILLPPLLVPSPFSLRQVVQRVVRQVEVVQVHQGDSSSSPAAPSEPQCVVVLPVDSHKSQATHVVVR